MSKFRRIAIAALAAVTVAVGSHLTAPQASAMPMSCTVRVALSQSYMATGNVFYGLGNSSAASYWYGRAMGIIEGC